MDDKYKIHMRYIIGILISIIVILLSVKWGQIENLVNLISFALTITSLVLAVLAIAYAVYSNNSFTSNISKLDSSSSEINTSSAKITGLIDYLTQKIDAIPELLQSIDQKADTTQKMIEEFGKQKAKEQEPTGSVFIQKNDSALSDLLHYSSPLGFACLLILKLSYDKQKVFNLKELCEECKLNYNYIYGFYVAILSFEVFTYEEISRVSKEGTIFDWKIKSLAKYIDDNINTAKEKFVKEYTENSTLSFLLEQLSTIEAYFEK